MAKSSFPGFKTGGGGWKKFLFGLTVLVVIVIVIKSPIEAAAAVDTAADKGDGALDSLIQFARALFNG
ncbi:hypothetical protein SAMN04489727_2148 [Amycolatopsis tolypomycina]|uniref:Uncharacterized protein n=1 Tax=Amycolatopsis tolypomycina TaxID=208445 RepID=A0A1H4I3V0_9PSEU|nr:hypothetical protein [Amycolatopsis tolypomycina]SEB28777.1 hypothetical protein SAMN04489727_0011 [Amycolatopsis tolypomycina]SEB49035.1 hypothetical protein SAMN04489727_2148 [Amycolatopsis tolypomycina]